MSSASFSVETSATRPSGNSARAREDGRDDTNRRNALLLIQLRWMAVFGQLVTILVTQFHLRIDLPLQPMLLLLLALTVLNLVSYAWLRYHSVITQRVLSLSLMFDVLTLTAQLYFSGGLENPFVYLYLLQITLGAVLLDARMTWSIVSLTTACLLLLFQQHVPLPASARSTNDFASLRSMGLLVCFVLNAALIVIFMSRISRNLRRRDKHLAELRQRAAEEEHIVRMGLLASGAAHELGTPLASLAVILGDWRRMPTVADQSVLMADIEDMQSAIQRCKAIVTGILRSSGEARGESTTITSIGAFLQEMIDEWRAARPSATLRFEMVFQQDLLIVSDPTIKQMISNLLDNAADVSPQQVRLRVSGDAEWLSIQVSDAGPGFPAEIREHFGKPYQSTKGRVGGGLGLFLVLNVARQLGGKVAASNLPQGGACVEVTLPVESLQVNVSEQGA